MIIQAWKTITGVQWLNGQPVMWQQVGPGAWPQGNNFFSSTGQMPQPFGQNWPGHIVPLPMVDPGISNVNVNQVQGSVIKELEDLKAKFEEEKKRTRDIFTMTSKEAAVLKDKITSLEVGKKGLEDKLEKEQQKTKCLEKKIQVEADELKKEKRLRKIAEEKVLNLEKGTSEAEKLSKVEKERELRKARAERLSKAEKERELRRAKANVKREETLRKIEGKKNSKEKVEEWDEEYLDCSGRGVGTISVKRRKSTEGQPSPVNANEVRNPGNVKPGQGKGERWIVGVSNAKKLKVGEDDKTGEGSNEKKADGNKKAVAGPSDGSKVPFS